MTAPITILLSVYNGARHLPSQLESFLAQTETNWRLCWRDDGSRDESCAVMHDFARRAGLERCAESASSGTHLGVARSFLRLLAENPEAPIIAFSDQDDRWLPHKLARARQWLQARGSRPTLYCARQILTDDNFSHPALSIRFDMAPSFPASLAQNIATGNTVAMNGAAAALVRAMPPPEAAHHDWWSYIVVSACGGEVTYDSKPCVLYRQHSNNAVGSPLRNLNRAISALRRGPSIYMTMMRRHVARLEAYRHLLHPQEVAKLELISGGLSGGFGARMAALRCPGFRRASWAETLIFRLWFLTNRKISGE